MRFNLLLVLVCLQTILSAQQNNLFLNRNIYNWYEPALNKQAAHFHTAIRPYRISEIDSVIRYDEIFHLRKVSNDHFFGKLWNWIGYDTIVGVSVPDFHMRIDPLINFAGGYDLENNGKGLWVNTRGVVISADIGGQRKVSFTTSVRENQAKYPDYLAHYINDVQVVPGQGKVRKFKQNAFDYLNATGYVSYTPSKYFNFQLGHDKNFIGDGYRSMLLSDNSLYYPFFKITSSFWKIKYMNLYTQFDDAMNIGPDGANIVTGVTRKWGSFHYLSVDVFDWAQVGLFEGIIWPNNDTTLTRGFDVNYLNPVIFFRPIEFGLGSPDNAVLGANVKFIPFDEMIVYGQFMMDDLDVAANRKGEGYYRNKFGIQAGMKFYGIKNLVLQAEMNQANPYTYAHKEPVQNYAHYNQPLAHPLGANFREFIAIVNYRFWERFYVEAKLQSAIVGYDQTAGENYGADIFKSDLDIPGWPEVYGNYIGQGLKTTIKSTDLRGGYLINPSINLNIEGQIFIRNFENTNQNIPTTMFMLALKTDLFNAYYDL